MWPLVNQWEMSKVKEDSSSEEGAVKGGLVYLKYNIDTEISLENQMMIGWRSSSLLVTTFWVIIPRKKIKP